MSEYIDFSSFCRFNHLLYVFHAYGYCICYILYILRHRRNDVDSIIIEELAYYCFSSHFFYTPYSSDLCAFAKLRIVIRFISFQNSFIKNKKIKIGRVYHSFYN